MPGGAEDRRIRALRPPKQRPRDPFAPPLTRSERERRRGRVERTLTVFLTGAECPFTCVFCDLWQETMEGPTPLGALPAQLDHALSAPGHGPPAVDRVKLYNASNWFDPRAVPPDDLDHLAAQVASYAGVTVESHARMLGPRCEAFADRINGQLEVAVGLETIHPEALPRLNKGMTLTDFDDAATWLRERELELRAFALVGVPFVPPDETVAWAVRTAEYALERGAAMVSLIPVRPDPSPGELARLAEEGAFTPPSLATLEEALDACRERGLDAVSADCWDLDRLAACPVCAPARRSRLAAMNLSGATAAAVTCAACDEAR